MTKDKNIIPFRLIDITTEQFADFKEKYVSKEEELEIELQTDIKISSTQRVVGIFTKFSFKQKGELVLVIESGCHFELAEEYWNTQTKNNILVLSKNILTHFLVLTVGTCRGILHTKKPKWLPNILLPTWNVSELINEDLEINLNENLLEEE